MGVAREALSAGGLFWGRCGSVKIDVAIADDQLDEVIDVISKAAYTGKIGDGKIFVAELQRVIRIRTGETDEAAL